MSQKLRSTFVLVNPTEILEALVGLKDVRVLAYERRGPHVELMVEQTPGEVSCPACGERAHVKERPVVHYVDLPVYGAAMSLAWKKHRMCCVNAACPTNSWVLDDHRIAAKNCLLTTRAAKWATLQVGTGRTVTEVAQELNCDWHTVNDAVTAYGEALLEADKRRLNRTSAIGLDETASSSWAATTRLTPRRSPTWPITRSSTSCPPGTSLTWPAGWTNRVRPGRNGSPSGPSTCPTSTPPSTR